MNGCSVENCGRPHKGYGYCESHYRRLLKHGTPLGRGRYGPDPRPLEERFWEKARVTDGCWLWNAHVAPNGYGVFKVAGKSVSAHRMAYELVVGSIPSGFQIDHLCRVRHCVNPDHLEAVTPSVNVLRSDAPRVASDLRRAGIGGFPHQIAAAQRRAAEAESAR